MAMLLAVFITFAWKRVFSPDAPPPRSTDHHLRHRRRRIVRCAFHCMAIFSTVLPVFLLSFAICRIGSGSASLTGTIGPAGTIYMAHVFLDESISLLQLAGSSLVLAGVLLISLNSRPV